MYIYIQITYKYHLVMLEVVFRFMAETSTSLCMPGEEALSFESCSIETSFDCKYTILIDMAPNTISFGAKRIGKV